MFFNKQVTCVVGPDDDVHMPRVSSLLDYEGELAIVIGTRCRHVPEDRAHEVIAGYTIANDVSVRDWQLRTPTMTMGKSFDTHGPLGPWVVTPDELGDPHDLGIRTYVNDELRQDGNTGEMIYDCFQQVAHLSEAFTLEPGDVIATGTPAGIGAVRQPFPEGLLKVGDVVRVEIDGIGELVNTVVEEPEGYLAPRERGAGGMGGLTPELREFLDANPVGVLATAAARRRPAAVARLLRARRRPAADLDARRDRLKARDVRRTGLGVAVRDGSRTALPVGDVLRPRRDPHREHRRADRSDRPAHDRCRRAARADERRGARRGRPRHPRDHHRASRAASTTSAGERRGPARPGDERGRRVFLASAPVAKRPRHWRRDVRPGGRTCSSDAVVRPLALTPP